MCPFILYRRLDVSMSLQRASYQRWQGQLARFQWLHEDILSSSSRHQPGMTLPSRGALMSDIKKVRSMGNIGVVAGWELVVGYLHTMHL